MPVDADGRGDKSGAKLTPEPGFGAAPFQGHVDHPEKLLPEKTSRNAAADLVVDGGRSSLTGCFPDIASHGRIDKRFPKCEACGPRQPKVNRSLIRVQGLVGAEVVRVNLPGAVADVVPGGV